jgi:sortase A
VSSTGGSTRRGRRRFSAAAVVGLLLLAAGLGALGWVGYQVFGTNVVAQQAFTNEKESLRAQWQQAPAPSPKKKASASPRASVPPPDESVQPGEAIGLLRIPALGSSYEVPILSGTDLKTLSRGIGHYSTTALPGQVGNFAVAGHRVTHGQPFAKLLELEDGDEVIVETRTSVFTYVLDEAPKDLTVDDDDSWVLDAVPGHPETRPTRALLTLTTCQDLFHSPDRSIGFAHLASTKNKG